MENIKIKLENYMDTHSKRGYFNGSVLVASKGVILLSCGYGMSNYEHEVLNTPQTKYRIGSITKGFTAMAILQLQEKGLLSIDDPINKILEKYPNGNYITIHQLLTHTSGIPNFTNFSDYWDRIMRLPSSLEELFDSFKELPLDFEPGTEFRYCNSSYIVLTAIIEKVSGLSYKNYIQNFILNPLKMINSGCDEGREIIKNLASGYSVWEDTIHPEYIDMSFPKGAFGMYSTIEDLFLWDQSLYNSKLVNEDSLRKMFNPYKDGYGYGWAVWNINLDGSNNLKFTSHFGDINGYSNDILRCIDEQITVIVLSNNEITPVMRISRDLAKIVLDQPVEILDIIKPVQINRQWLFQYIGTYEVNNFPNPIIISESSGQLYLTMAKKYGKEYKLKLTPIAVEDNKIDFVTEMINEKVVIRKLEKNFELRHIDVNLHEVLGKKVISNGSKSD